MMTAYFTPESDLAEDTSYSVTINTAIEDLAGLQMMETPAIRPGSHPAGMTIPSRETHRVLLLLYRRGIWFGNTSGKDFP
jgi:hypothetical protein